MPFNRVETDKRISEKFIRDVDQLYPVLKKAISVGEVYLTFARPVDTAILRPTIENVFRENGFEARFDPGLSLDDIDLEGSFYMGEDMAGIFTLSNYTGDGGDLMFEFSYATSWLKMATGSE